MTLSREAFSAGSKRFRSEVGAIASSSSPCPIVCQACFVCRKCKSSGGRDLPEEFGPWATAWDLFNKWDANGTLDKILDRLRGACMELDEIDDEL